ncbi:Mannose-1-phosphate guanylyltransferase (GDP) [Acidisarcina polymorpha]|uniref:mannose-1-phosphate guanylyltransferase n=1 Tax=Acidisarcina polymorpha TaxID=2211140 RepID=A0A2Z5G9N7_9BACT|nr:mannose-1-phosphate guanylyltransferase [Acidisarcina polymorpha]AXC15276.1 Mannose-1-phosphate guanylyltransferase (GDP) [Acidisarcina polymorpha]
MTKANTEFRPIILAGGSGTRFWPLSRRARAKQVLVLDGDRSMIQQTVDRLAPLAAADKFWVITNSLLSDTIVDQLSGLPAEQILSEPAARNTAPAAGLAAFLLERESPHAVLGMFPADHVIGDEPAFVETLTRAIQLAATGENIVVLGVTPTRPETGYGYVETGAPDATGAMRVRRFTEKPDLERATAFLAAGNYYWNSGIFIWSARTLAEAIREHLPSTAKILEKIAAAFGTPDFESTFEELYPQCENVSVDVAVLEPRSAKGEGQSNIFCFPADFGWNDLGSWTTLYDHTFAKGAHTDADNNVVQTADSLAVNATGNYVFSPKKFVALVGVKDLVVVETEDAILITTRSNSQDVGKVVKHLTSVGKTELV